MARPDSNVSPSGNNPAAWLEVERDLRRLYRIEAFVELLRHYHESTQLCEALQNRADGPLRDPRSLPVGAYWPGQVTDRCITSAFHSVFEDVRTVQESLDKTLRPRAAGSTCGE